MLRRVLCAKFEFGDDALYLAETLVRRASIVIEPDCTVRLIIEDPVDNRVLEVATEGAADAIASGDQHFLDVKGIRGHSCHVSAAVPLSVGLSESGTAPRRCGGARTPHTRTTHCGAG